MGSPESNFHLTIGFGHLFSFPADFVVSATILVDWLCRSIGFTVYVFGDLGLRSSVDKIVLYLTVNFIELMSVCCWDPILALESMLCEFAWLRATKLRLDNGILVLSVVACQACPLRPCALAVAFPGYMLSTHPHRDRVPFVLTLILVVVFRNSCLLSSRHVNMRNVCLRDDLAGDAL